MVYFIGLGSNENQKNCGKQSFCRTKICRSKDFVQQNLQNHYRKDTQNLLVLNFTWFSIESNSCIVIYNLQYRKVWETFWLGIFWGYSVIDSSDPVRTPEYSWRKKTTKLRKKECSVDFRSIILKKTITL